MAPSFKQLTSVRERKETEETKSFVLDSKNQRYIDDLAGVQKIITDILDKKTKEGINKLIRESGQFNTIDGLTFKNINQHNDSLSLDTAPYRSFKGYTKILLKDSDNKIKKGYLIKDNRYIVKNYDIKTPNTLPRHPQFYTASEAKNIGISEEIEKLLRIADTALLKTRRFVCERKDTDLKPPAAKMDVELISKLSSILTLMKETDNVSSQIPPSTLTKSKTEFGDYVLQHGRGDYKFKNIGSEKLQMVFSEFLNEHNGAFLRLMVYNPDETVKTGYLFKDNKIISNFNPDYQSFLPEKLDFADINEINDYHYNEELKSYIDLYEEKLNSYKTFLIQKKETPFNAISKEGAERLKVISSLYSQIEKSLSSVSNVSANKIKNAYPDFEIKAGKKGYTFKNVGPDKKTINIYKSKSNNADELLNINMLDTEFEKSNTLTIKNNDRYVSNYKVPEKVMKEKLRLLNYLPSIKTKLTEFKEVSENYKESVSVKTPKLKEHKASDVQKVQTEPKPDRKRGKPVSKEYVENPWLKEKEYQDLINESIKEFKNAVKRMKGNMEIFDETTTKIREKLVRFIEDKKNTQQ